MILPGSDAELVTLLGEQRASWTRQWGAFRAFVAARPTAVAAHVADLHLAFSAANHVEAAVAELADRLRRLALSTRRSRLSDDTIDEARQVLLERLVMGKDGAPPKVCSYHGEGALDGWLRVALAREALYLSKRSTALESDDLLALEAIEDDSETPEVRYLKAHYRDKFRSAFERACNELGRKERALLRQHLVLGISVARLAIIYGVHRTTAARWIDLTREDLMRQTKRLLESDLGLPGGEVERIAALIQSRLDFSLHRVLRTRDREAS